MNSAGREKLDKLIQNGAKIPNPESVLIGDEVSLDRIAAHGVVIYPGCKILGEKTLIMPGVKLGYEGPVTIEDCQMGTDVELRGGFFRRSTFLDKSSMGSGGHVRDGCLLEEQANGAHTVGLKQTILFPFVTLGSLINFCDCLMAGGTSRENHSEVGSSYIHFNYTVNQDKATPSLIGDVPRGVMLNQPPVFLGGQGGLAGPVRVEYGSVVAAGVVCRKDICDGGKLMLAQGLPDHGVEASGYASNFYPGIYWYVKRRVVNNVNYIANIIALRHWYEKVRSLFFLGDSMGEELHAGALDKVGGAVEERIERFGALAQKMPESAQRYRRVMKGQHNERLLAQKQELFDRWQDVRAVFVNGLEDPGDDSVREGFLEEVARHAKENGGGYVTVIQGLDESWAVQGSKWLQGIVDGINDKVFDVLPSFSCKPENV